MLKRINNTRLWLWNLFRSHIKRITFSIVVALPLIVFGAWLLDFEVQQQEVNPMAAYLLNWPLITLLAFASNRWILWSDRGTNWWTALKRWVVVSLGHSVIGFSVFSLLVEFVGWDHLTVSLGLTAALGLGSYILRNLWIFVADRHQVAVKA